MTRSEFDQQIRELKNKKGNAIREIAALQSEIKEEIAAKHRQINDIYKEIAKSNQSLQGYHQRRIALENEWNAKVSAFIKENEPSTTSNLAEANTLNIIYELRRRGFAGIVSKDADELSDSESYDIQKMDWKRLLDNPETEVPAPKCEDDCLIEMKDVNGIVRKIRKSDFIESVKTERKRFADDSFWPQEDIADMERTAAEGSKKIKETMETHPFFEHARKAGYQKGV